MDRELVSCVLVWPALICLSSLCTVVSRFDFSVPDQRIRTSCSSVSPTGLLRPGSSVLVAHVPDSVFGLLCFSRVTRSCAFQQTGNWSLVFDL
jgi:hypothetical protein